jgi:8-hydroxy-5-deazaflavin:NADPH oxidoreductase
VERQEVADRPDPFALPDISALTIGIIGGTGEQGRGLALRWAAAGMRVILGSRDSARAEAVARDIGNDVRGLSNVECAEGSDVVVIAVPWAAHRDTVVELERSLRGRIVVDCVNPLGFDRLGAYPLSVPEGSAAQQAAALLPDSRVVAAFNHISAVLLLDVNVAEITADVLVLGDEREATDTVQALAAMIPGVRGIYAGRLRNACQVEALTANLISVNRRYRSHAGVRLTDV